MQNHRVQSERITMELKTPSEESLSERINKRDRERKNVIEKRKEEKQQLVVETEQASYFKDAFYSTCSNIRKLLETAESAAQTASLSEIFDKVNKDILMLKNYLFESKIFLKMYDIRKAQEALQTLESDAAQLEAKLIPRKKFGFKNRKIIKKSLEKPSDVTDGFKDLKIAEAANGVEKQSNKKIYSKYGDNTCMLLEKVDETLVMDAENVNKNDVLLSDLTRCTVRIYGTPNTLHMVSLVQCTILIGPVTTSVFVDDCRDCEFAFACQQLRLHSSTNCKIYLHVTSRAIIEDCTKIFVAPYNWTYEDQANHFKLAGLDPKINNWDAIDDFNWLSNEKSSPNWSVLEPELRVKSWD